MHGRVTSEKGKGQTSGFLYFSPANADGLKLYPARPVGAILKRHSVPLAILDVCQFAQANRGDEANIAKVLASEGVQVILTMTFKVSAQAASIFMDVFYQQLLLRGSSFSFAVAAGRAAP